MDTLLFCFANDRDRPLPSLRDEDEGIDRLLDPRSSRNHFRKVRDSFATTDSVADKLLIYQQSLALFHFSGHAGQTFLQLEDQPARGEGIARLLGRCPNLRVVFLNGCSTRQQVELLRKQNVQAVIIATSTPVQDTVATDVALWFYEALVNQTSVQEALEQVQDRLKVKEATTIAVDRGMAEMDEEITRNQWYVHYPSDEAARWRLPSVAETAPPTYRPNAELRVALVKILSARDPTLRELYLSRQTALKEKSGSKNWDAELEAFREWLNEELLKRLPYPLAEPLRKLLCPEFVNGKFIEPAPSTDRLKHYLTLVDSSVDLLFSLFMALARNRLLAGVGPAAATRQELLHLHTQGWNVSEPDTLLHQLRTLAAFALEAESALPGLTELVKSVDEGSPMAASLPFFNTLRRQSAAGADAAALAGLCELGENRLCDLLHWVGFWADYRLESFNTIWVISYFNAARKFNHERVVLRTSEYYQKSNWRFQEVSFDEPWECQSVLLVRTQRQIENGQLVENDMNQFLNLSPYIIDRNVYIKSDNSVFDLYSFQSCSDQQVRFRHMARPGDDPLTVSLQKASPDADFSLLREQIRTMLTLIGGETSRSPDAAVRPPDDMDLSLVL